MNQNIVFVLRKINQFSKDELVVDKVQYKNCNIYLSENLNVIIGDVQLVSQLVKFNCEKLGT